MTRPIEKVAFDVKVQSGSCVCFLASVLVDRSANLRRHLNGDWPAAGGFLVDLAPRPCRSHPSVLLIGQFTVCGIGIPDSQQALSSICAYLPCRENSTDTCPGTSALIVGPSHLATFTFPAGG